MKKIKVLHIFGQMNRGGAEMRTMDLMEKLNADPNSGIQFDFCALSGKPGELDPLIQSLGGVTHYLPLNLEFSRKFKKLIDEQGYSAIHSHVQLFSGYLLKLAAEMKVPVRICHLHTTGEKLSPFQFRKRIQNHWMCKWLKRYATHIIGVSQGALNAFFEVAPELQNDPRCVLIYDAIIPEKFENRVARDTTRENISMPRDVVGLIHVGRIDAVKNHGRLVEIFSELRKKIPAAHLVLVGHASSAAKENLVQQITRLHLNDSVHLLGSRSDIADLFFASDFMIFPSLWEGLPGVVLEASSAGVPVLSSNLPGSHELAHYFPTIECLDLSVKDSEWVEKALAMIEKPRESKEASLARLKSSPFAIDSCLKILLPMWRGK